MDQVGKANHSIIQRASALMCGICKQVTSTRTFLFLYKCLSDSAVNTLLTSEKLVLGIFTRLIRPHLYVISSSKGPGHITPMALQNFLCSKDSALLLSGHPSTWPPTAHLWPFLYSLLPCSFAEKNVGFSSLYLAI